MNDHKVKITAAWQMLPSPQVTAAMASLGFDWIVVDMEHSAITTQEAEAIFIAAERYQARPFVRLPSADPYLARRLLDSGAQGIIVPVVESRAGCDDFASHCIFPSGGRRGLGLTRANLWGGKFDEYFQSFKPVIIAQIETKTGAEAIESIIESEYLDGVMIGPYDLSASLGKAGQFNDPEFLALRTSILDATRAKKKLIGYHQVAPEPAELKARQDEGYDFVAYGTDLVAIRHALKGIKP